jgi:hypothetical protein
MSTSLLLYLGLALSFSNGPNQATQADENDLVSLKQERVSELEVVARQLKVIIETKQHQELLDTLLLDSVIGWGPGDVEFSRKEILEQFKGHFGLVYCALFDTACLRTTHKGGLADSALSLFEIFTTKGPVRIRIHDFEDVTGAERLPKLDIGWVSFEWNEEPSKTGHLMYPEFQFYRLEEGKWEIGTIVVE